MKKSLPRITTAIVVAFLVSSAVGEQPSPSAWPQYGHRVNWRSGVEFPTASSITKAWDIEIGEGRSQVVGQENEIYVTTGFSEDQGDGQSLVTTKTLAIDALTGKQKWSYEQTSSKAEPQQTFGGASISPQATPAITSSRLITISFTGQLTCLDRSNGKRLWEKDLVGDFGAKPVQFGFSASPVVDPLQPDRVYVLASGKTGGLMCLSVSNGSVVWQADCDTFSYATPVEARLGGVDQWVIVSENEVLGIAKVDGERLWRYELPGQGLTNVPTPIVFDESHVVISGQGCQGTRCLSISHEEQEWSAEEQWFSGKLQYFYTNWIRLADRMILGCTDKYLAAFDVRDGSVLGRWRGYGDGNLVIAGRHLLLLDGKGQLSVLETMGANGSTIINRQQFKVLNARCWTPMTIIGNRLFVRGDNRLVCLTLNENAGAQPLENLLTSAKTLEFDREPSAQSTPDPVERIFETFESKGQQAALELYEKLRAAQQLDEEARIALAEAAQQEGLTDVTRMIMGQAVEDFPNSKRIKSAAASLSGK